MLLDLLHTELATNSLDLLHTELATNSLDLLDVCEHDQSEITCEQMCFHSISRF